MKIKDKINKLEKEIEVLKKQMQEKEWVTIDYSVMPKELFVKYGIKPFKIMRKKMRDEDGEVWNCINFFDAKKECEKRGYRLPDVREMLALLEYYKNTQKKVSVNDKEFLGIEELSYDEDVCYEWIEGAGCAFLRGAPWDRGAHAGLFPLYLSLGPSDSGSNIIGFRCASAP